ncbi:MAG: flagellar basal body-associated FliL family protein [Actinobacteria bacterium]|jgi:flagellar FliL protein|nr:flagellar basal body-associated FliL family protein [Actinomycetota bacterium]MCL6094623.1 flagellar basal body-associated FliL family protein [Actinomycetota bacterium]
MSIPPSTLKLNLKGTTAQAGTSSSAPPETPPPAKKSKKKILILVGLVVVLLAAAAVLLGPKLLHKSKPNPADVPLGKIFSLPQVTTNLADGDLVQVTVALQLTKAADITKVEADEPRFSNAIISVFGSMRFSQLLNSAGKTQAQAAILSDVQEILGDNGGLPQVVAVYFTTFTMQQ